MSQSFGDVPWRIGHDLVHLPAVCALIWDDDGQLLMLMVRIERLRAALGGPGYRVHYPSRLMIDAPPLQNMRAVRWPTTARSWNSVQDGPPTY